MSTTLPKGLRDVVKAYDQQQRGLTSRTGEAFVPAEEYNCAHAIAQGIGFAPSKTSAGWEERIADMRTMNKARDAAKRLRQRFVNASPQERLRILKEDLPEHNREYGMLSTGRLKVDGLWKAVRSRAEREAQMQATGMRYAVPTQDLPYFTQ